MTATTSYTIQPLSPEATADLLAGPGELCIVDASPGYPCRRCLRDAAVGDEVLLVSYIPFDSDSAFQSASPIYLHTAPCEPAGNGHPLPVQLTSRDLSVRVYDQSEMLIDYELIEGSQLDETLQRLFENKSAHVLRIYNAGPGCWAANVERCAR